MGEVYRVEGIQEVIAEMYKRQDLDYMGQTAGTEGSALI